MAKRTRIRRTDEEKAAILAQLGQSTVKEVAERNGVNAQMLGKWAAAAGIKAGVTRRGRFTPEQRGAILDAVDSRPSGTPLEQAAKAQGVSVATIMLWRKGRAQSRKGADAPSTAPLSNGNGNGHEGRVNLNAVHPAVALAQAEALLASALTQCGQARQALAAFWAAFGDGGQANAHAGTGPGNGPRTRRTATAN